jgi:DNA-binding response OmpR family regulator
MTSKKPSILIVEDEGLIALHLQELLLNAGFDVPDMVSSGEDAIEGMRSFIPDLILMDITLDGKLDGIETARYIRKSSDIPIIFLTAHSEKKRLVAAEDLAPYGFLGKPFDFSDVVSAVEKALHR